MRGLVYKICSRLTPLGFSGAVINWGRMEVGYSGSSPACTMQGSLFTSPIVMLKRFKTSRSNGEPFHYDPLEGIQRDVATETVKRGADELVRSLLPAFAPPEAVMKAKQHILQHPINELIAAEKVVVTHTVNEKGEETRAGLPPCSLDEALQLAREKGVQLVQMAYKNGTAYCRIRDEKSQLLQLVQQELDAAEAASSSQKKKKPMLQHQFRDVVDAHFIGWKSKKIIADLKKGHPVKLVIREYQNWEGALEKLREMCRAVQKVGEAEKVPHLYTSIIANSTEVSVSYAPPVSSGGGGKTLTIKHPVEKDWAHAKKRMEEACRKSGRFGTYVKVPSMKPRNLGETTYRVDKYGRRME